MKATDATNRSGLSRARHKIPIKVAADIAKPYVDLADEFLPSLGASRASSHDQKLKQILTQGNDGP